ncbi:uncharacterized protein STEHIDRAFT_93328 [Stereum hirsutum FP-91666 SS1]|uniref:uncharacterized protein n=1 Tax=Stereum hirsutum (strain FP-91666) TaxID=721885 RepID=UPI000440D12C|nr:uncharacterized protein STEHIDRAFT_93328 [Stereum hirsutum FP-91666 SS1]EIM90378.1 hypothetical protein STEHIDRAFT_93328 [Stereum hirsutum FP-91666 SS1]
MPLSKRNLFPQALRALSSTSFSFSWAPKFQYHSSPEYEQRARKHFTPPTTPLAALHCAIPKRLQKRSTRRSLYYVARHLAFTWAFYILACHIDAWSSRLTSRLTGPSSSPSSGSGVKVGAEGETNAGLGLDAVDEMGRTMVKTMVAGLGWCAYWWWQGIAFAGIWCLAHEAGHDALSPYGWVNTAIGIVLHTTVLVPYFSWKITHRTHHKFTNNLERDETHIPFTRRDLVLPVERIAVRTDYKHIVEETPVYTLCRLIMRQFLGYQLYLIYNRKGNPRYPAGTSHFRPSSQIFKPEDRNLIIISNVCIGTMLSLLAVWMYFTGFANVCKLYIIPWLCANNWIITITYLQHSDPTIPYYRRDQWTFVRGALTTVDRPLLGWIGRFFLHNAAHDAVAHHFFPSIPFYNQPEVTRVLKPLLSDQYNYDSTPTLYALWRSFTQCTFIEPDGDIVFYKNQQGTATRIVNPKVVPFRVRHSPRGSVGSVGSIETVSSLTG